MTTTQILLLALFLLIVYRFVKKSMVSKSVKHYEPEEVRGLMKSGRNHILLDVRTPKEHSDQIEALTPPRSLKKWDLLPPI